MEPSREAIADTRPPAERRSQRQARPAPAPQAAGTQDRSDRSEESGPVHQSRVELAGVQRARAGSGARHIASVARASEVSRHHRDQPRRVLHDSRGHHAEEAPRRDRRRRARWRQHRAAARGHARAGASDARRSGRDLGRVAEAAREGTDLVPRRRRVDTCGTRVPERLFLSRDLSRAHAARLRPWSPVPVHLESEQELRGRRPARRPYQVRQGESARTSSRVSSRYLSQSVQRGERPTFSSRM